MSAAVKPGRIVWFAQAVVRFLRLRSARLDSERGMTGVASVDDPHEGDRHDPHGCGREPTTETCLTVRL